MIDDEKIVSYILHHLNTAVRQHFVKNDDRIINMSPMSLETRAKEIYRFIKEKLNKDNDNSPENK